MEIQFKVDNIEESRKVLETKGATFTETKSDQGKSYLVRDPYGMNFLMYQDRGLKS